MPHVCQSILRYLNAVFCPLGLVSVATEYFFQYPDLLSYQGLPTKDSPPQSTMLSNLDSQSLQPLQQLVRGLDNFTPTSPKLAPDIQCYDFLSTVSQR